MLELKQSLWTEAVANVVYILNGCPTRAYIPIHPEKHGVKGGFALHIYMCLEVLYMRWLWTKKKNKLDAKEIKYVFLSYCKGTKAYRLMYLETKKKIKDVIFMKGS